MSETIHPLGPPRDNVKNKISELGNIACLVYV